MGPMYGHVGGAWGWGLLGPVLTLLFWGGLVLGIVLLVRGGGLGAGGREAPPPPRPTEDRALAILRERYARGEIDTAEYEERRRRLLDESSTL
jgi:putative membrane protein